MEEKLGTSGFGKQRGRTEHKYDGVRVKNGSNRYGGGYQPGGEIILMNGFIFKHYHHNHSTANNN